MKRTIKVGDTVTYRGAWGTEPPKEAKVTDIELCENEHEKYGIEVNEVSGVRDIRRSVFGLDDHHWCYGYQIVM